MIYGQNTVAFKRLVVRRIQFARRIVGDVQELRLGLRGRCKAEGDSEQCRTEGAGRENTVVANLVRKFRKFGNPLNLLNPLNQLTTIDYRLTTREK